MRKKIEYWRKFPYLGCHDLYSSAEVIRMIKSSEMRLVRNVACMGEKRNVNEIRKERDAQ